MALFLHLPASRLVYLQVSANSLGVTLGHGSVSQIMLLYTRVDVRDNLTRFQPGYGKLDHATVHQVRCQGQSHEILARLWQVRSYYFTRLNVRDSFTRVWPGYGKLGQVRSCYSRSTNSQQITLVAFVGTVQVRPGRRHSLDRYVSSIGSPDLRSVLIASSWPAQSLCQRSPGLRSHHVSIVQTYTVTMIAQSKKDLRSHNVSIVQEYADMTKTELIVRKQVQ